MRQRIGEWNGRPVEVTSWLIPRFLWQTASSDVYIDQQCVLKTCGPLKSVGGSKAIFEHSGAVHTMDLTWGRPNLRSFPIEVTIDGSRLPSARVITGNWPLAFWPVVAALAVVISKQKS